MYLFKRKGIYYCHYYNELEAKDKRISTKCRTKPEALQFVSQLKSNLALQIKIKQVSLRKFREEYENHVGNTKSRGYVKTIEYAFNHFEKVVGKDSILSRIGIREVEQFIYDNFKTKNHGTALIYRNLRAAFNKAIDWNYIDQNPFNRVKLPKIPKPLPLFIPEDEFREIIENEPDENLKALYTLAYNTGMRLNEIRNLQWSNIDLQSREITVAITDSFITKDKEERKVPINEPLFRIISERLPKVMSLSTSYVFEKLHGMRYNEYFISKRFKKVIRKLKLNEKYHFHSLRHSFCSNLAKQKVPLNVIMELAGHSQISTTMIYTHLQNQQLHDAVKSLE